MSKSTFVYTTYIRTTPEKLWETLTDSQFVRKYWSIRLNRSTRQDSHLKARALLHLDDRARSATSIITVREASSRLPLRYPSPLSRSHPREPLSPSPKPFLRLASTTHIRERFDQ